MDILTMMALILLMATWRANAVDVVKYGAAGDGRTDDSQAFLRAWADVCGGRSDSTLYVPPRRRFLLKPIKFQGPCRPSSVKFMVMGRIVAPYSTYAWNGHALSNWIEFYKVNGLTIKGNGIIDGNGAIWWQQAYRYQLRPTAISINNCNNLKLRGMSYINSPQGHISIAGCQGVSVANVRIFAPATSPNTDGIDIAQSTRVHILNSIIGTGDDCIAIGDSTSFVRISGVHCGPGHGISIGSLGRNGAYSTVEQVYVSDCSFSGATNGLRIKTWQGGSGYVRHVTYERIKIEATANPIIIDQYYCVAQSCHTSTSAVRISDVTYNKVYGTSTTDAAIKIDCSQSIGCSNIVLNNINMRSATQGKLSYASCINAHGRSSYSVPTVKCLL